VTTDEILIVIRDYIEERDGKVFVAGPVTVEKRPGDPEFVNHFVVKFTGKPPKKKVYGDAI
jgi:hypothetical protein